MTKCPETKFIREEIKENIRKILGRVLIREVEDLPSWWDAEEVRAWGSFKAKWGAMGVIPAKLNKKGYVEKL